MDDREIAKLLEQYKVTGSPPESFDVQFSSGSQDSISNILLDCDPVTLEFNRFVDRNDLDCNASIQELTAVNNYKLHVSFESQTLPVTKSTAWTFSESQNRLYVNISQPCPIRLRLEPPLPAAGLRCFLRYQKSSYRNDPVTQCANHSNVENNLSLRGHVLRCKQVGVQYEMNEQLGRYSLFLPFNRLRDDVGGTCVFEFKCLSTCLGRRPMELVFQVECSGSVVCCHSVNVRVCSCPGRDRRRDEIPMKNQNLLNSQMKSKQTAGPSHCCPSKRHLDDDEEFTIKVKGRKNYELLVALKQRLEMADAYECQGSQLAEEKSDVELASPKAKMLMTTKERKEQLKDEANGLFESADIDRSHHRRRSHQLQQSQNQLTGKMRKNKALPVTDVSAVLRE